MVIQWNKTISWNFQLCWIFKINFNTPSKIDFQWHSQKAYYMLIPKSVSIADPCPSVLRQLPFWKSVNKWWNTIQIRSDSISCEIACKNLNFTLKEMIDGLLCYRSKAGNCGADAKIGSTASLICKIDGKLVVYFQRWLKTFYDIIDNWI